MAYLLLATFIASPLYTGLALLLMMAIISAIIIAINAPRTVAHAHQSTAHRAPLSLGSAVAAY